MVDRRGGWVVKQRHIVAVRSVEIFAAFAILEVENRYGEFALYFINPINQKKQLRRTGFECKYIAASNRRESRYFDSMPYYVAQKTSIPSLPR